jgi:hypothetical protein
MLAVEQNTTQSDLILGSMEGGTLVGPCIIRELLHLFAAMVGGIVKNQNRVYTWLSIHVGKL